LLHPVWSLISADDETPDGFEISLIGALEHNEIVTDLMDGIRVAVLLAEVDQYYGETIKLKANLADIILLSIGDVDRDVCSLVREYLENARVLLASLILDSQIVLGGNVTLGTVAEAPCSTEMVS
jgi:hypothetical protein